MRTIYRRLRHWGFDPRIFFFALTRILQVLGDKATHARQQSSSVLGKDFLKGRNNFIFEDKTDSAGIATGHYFLQDLVVAQEIYRQQPSTHVDIGSSVYGFVSHVASFMEITVLDIRSLDCKIPEIKFSQVDVMNPAWEIEHLSSSISCLHALEHFGLGRYGDPIDFEGWKRGYANIVKMVSPGGRLYLSVPTGTIQRVEFNAHRVFSLPYLRNLLLEDFLVAKLHFVDDANFLHRDVSPNGIQAEHSFGSHYGLSIWFLDKRG